MDSWGRSSISARATVRPPRPESNSPIGLASLMLAPTWTRRGAPPMGPPSPPQRLLDLLASQILVRRPRLRGQVLPAAVGQQAHDVSPVHARRYPLRHVQHGARGDPREDALLLRQLTGRPQRV